jgi:hypothetical protein
MVQKGWHLRLHIGKGLQGELDAKNIQIEGIAKNDIRCEVCLNGGIDEGSKNGE